jgi:hypothetical protein
LVLTGPACLNKVVAERATFAELSYIVSCHVGRRSIS